MARKKVKRQSKKKGMKLFMWLVGLVGGLALVAGGWWAYSAGYWGDYIGEEVEIFEVGIGGGKEGDVWPKLAQVWDLESKREVNYEKGGWGQKNFNQLKLDGGVLKAYVYDGSYLQAPKSLVKTLKVGKDWSVVNGGIGVRMMVKNPVAKVGAEVNSYPDESQNLKWSFLPEVDQVYDKIESKLVIYGRRRYPLKGGSGYTKWQNGVIKEVSATAEKVKANQFFEMKFDLGEVNPDYMQVSRIFWYPVVDYQASEGVKMLPVGFRNKKLNRRYYYQVGIDSLSFWFMKLSVGGEGESDQLIGGDKDEGGCLIGAGYSWCEAKQKCLRVWEEPCE